MTRSRFRSLLPTLALAGLTHAAPRSDVTVSHLDLTLPRGVRARLVHTDQHGEPADNDRRLRIEVYCPGDPEPHVLAHALAACEFESFQWVREKDILEVRYRVATDNEGLLECARMRTKTYAPPCP